jgi:hypothetical protein
MIDDPLALLSLGIWLFAAGMWPVGFIFGACSPCCASVNPCTSTQPEPDAVSVEITAVNFLYQNTEVTDTTGIINWGLATDKVSVALPTSALNGTHVLSKTSSSSNSSTWSKTISALLPNCGSPEIVVTVRNDPSLASGTAYSVVLSNLNAPGRVQREFSNPGAICPTPQYYSSFDECEFLATDCEWRNTITGGISFAAVCQNGELTNLPPHSNPYGTAEFPYNRRGSFVSRTIDADNRTTAVTIDDVIITRP